MLYGENSKDIVDVEMLREKIKKGYAINDKYRTVEKRDNLFKLVDEVEIDLFNN